MYVLYNTIHILPTVNMPIHGFFKVQDVLCINKNTTTCDANMYINRYIENNVFKN